jgi:hypothetical protein
MSEHDEQAAVFDYLFLKIGEHPEIHPLFFAVPNGAHLAGDSRRRAQQASKLKAEGVVPGVADTVFLCGRGGYLGMTLEMKTEARRKDADGGMSDSQKEFLRAAKMEGYNACVAYGAEDAVQIIGAYLQLPKTQDMIYRALRELERGNTDKCKTLLQSVVRVW